ncbi:GTP cyclohydrolase II [Dillenia turbinata]|uniref:GTP cyclohydrolase II n=1 Tax=Dillenia turbinata TaxID=194707 RepID=A0AAN8VQB6_9MAGN
MENFHSDHYDSSDVSDEWIQLLQQLECEEEEEEEEHEETEHGRGQYSGESVMENFHSDHDDTWDFSYELIQLFQQWECEGEEEHEETQHGQGQYPGESKEGMRVHMDRLVHDLIESRKLQLFDEWDEEELQLSNEWEKEDVKIVDSAVTSSSRPRLFCSTQSHTGFREVTLATMSPAKGHKLRAYNLQDQGHDTAEAKEELGLPVDARENGIDAIGNAEMEMEMEHRRDFEKKPYLDKVAELKAEYDKSMEAIGIQC